MPIDILFGSPRLRETLTAATVDELSATDASAWDRATRPFRLYEGELG
jgi:hypothetical protein